MGKTILVTGATDGIGLETAVTLARGGARILLHGRNANKAGDAANRVREAGGSCEVILADLSSMKQVQQLGSTVRLSGHVDVLIHNAGVFMKERVLTEDGFETTFAVNHLAPFLLTREILPAMKSGGRVITLSSIAHRNGKLDFENLNAERSFDGYAAYALSKLCNVFFAYELARRTKDEGIASNAVHPGVIQTKLLKKGFNMTQAGSLAEGAATSVFLALSPEVEGVTGKYFTSSRESASTPETHNADLGRALWEHSVSLLSRFA